MTDYWLSLALTDDAFLHIILGCADSHFAPFGLCERPRTLKHLNAAISIVTRRIENDNHPSEATLVVVATMAMLEVCYQVVETGYKLIDNRRIEVHISIGTFT